MTIQEATKDYEAWLARHIRVLKADVAAKHALMAQDAFAFFRATFYRWMQLLPDSCPNLSTAPKVLAVGDLHVENYGTWRDAEGRLIWGINDFDEAFPLAYTVDLVRVATSASLAIELNHIPFATAAACAAILDGYTQGLANGGEPFVLSEKHAWLHEAVTSRLRDPVTFWQKFAALPPLKTIPAPAAKILKQALPKDALKMRVVHRRSGLGSLGRERFTAIAEWHGGNIAREAKALLPSACVWAGGLHNQRIYYAQILKQSVRATDPFTVMRGKWIARRLAPYCSRIELQQLPRGRYAEKLLHAMGRELANVHLGTRGSASAVQKDLKQRGPKWLLHATEVMTEVTLKDWKKWK
jgi:Uncharacterized protein conserved in bacteria (DUF2252)